MEGNNNTEKSFEIKGQSGLGRFNLLHNPPIEIIPAKLSSVDKLMLSLTSSEMNSIIGLEEVSFSSWAEIKRLLVQLEILTEEGAMQICGLRREVLKEQELPKLHKTFNSIKSLDVSKFIISKDLLELLVNLFPNLEKLKLETKDISPLVGLTGLKELNLKESYVENISFIPKGVRKLDLSHCELITDFSPLQELKEIEELELHWGKISNLLVIPRGVRRLGLLCCRAIIDFTPLQEFKEIEELDLGSTEISDLSLIPKGAKKLVLRSCQSITDFTPLQEFKEIEELDLSNTKISDLSLIPRGLRKLNLGLCQLITSFTPLQELKEIEDLDLSLTAIINLSLIPKGVRKLRLWGCTAIIDFTLLQELKEIEELDLIGTNIEDLSFLPKSLKILRLDACNVLYCPDWLKDRIRNNGINLIFIYSGRSIADQEKRLLELPSTTQPANINSPSKEPTSTEASASSAGLASIPSSALEGPMLGNAIGAWAAKSK